MDDGLIRVLLVGLAGWRLAYMLVVEDGPWDVFLRTRERFAVDPGEITGFWGLLLACIYCTSVWTSTAMWLAWEVHWAIPALVASWAVALITNRHAA